MASEGLWLADVLLAGATLVRAAFRVFRYVSCNCMACTNEQVDTS